ncbi:MAG: Gfo/Idh/MocA family protein, partial [Planctomycetota bacterium]
MIQNGYLKALPLETISRRQFLKRSTVAVTAAIAAPYVIPSSVLGKAGSIPPSERITMAAIGIGGMGTHDLKNFLEQNDVQVLAVCDVDTNHRIRAKKVVDSAYGNKDCSAYNNFHDILTRKDVDTVMIATPDHWHAVISIEAAKAGKHIYCEKPISLTIAEGRAVADTMKRYGTVYQSGT